MGLTVGDTRGGEGLVEMFNDDMGWCSKLDFFAAWEEAGMACATKLLWARANSEDFVLK